jgi:hypothetical protein
MGFIITLQCYDEYLEKKSLAAPLAHLSGVPKVTGGKKLRFKNPKPRKKTDKINRGNLRQACGRPTMICIGSQRHRVWSTTPHELPQSIKAF